MKVTVAIALLLAACGASESTNNGNNRFVQTRPTEFRQGTNKNIAQTGFWQQTEPSSEVTNSTLVQFEDVIPAGVNDTCRTTCKGANFTCMKGSCRCSHGGQGFCAPPYPGAVGPNQPVISCLNPNHVVNCGGYKLCCGAGLGECVDGNHPMCVKQ